MNRQDNLAIAMNSIRSARLLPRPPSRKRSQLGGGEGGAARAYRPIASSSAAASFAEGDEGGGSLITKEGRMQVPKQKQQQRMRREHGEGGEKERRIHHQDRPRSERKKKDREQGQQQQQQQQQLRWKPPRARQQKQQQRQQQQQQQQRRVHFYPHMKVVLSTPHSLYSHDEFVNSWYSKEECMAMRAEAMRIVRAAREAATASSLSSGAASSGGGGNRNNDKRSGESGGGGEGECIFCVRGLEHLIHPRSIFDRRRRKDSVSKAVLDEQERQRVDMDNKKDGGGGNNGAGVAGNDAGVEAIARASLVASKADRDFATRRGAEDAAAAASLTLHSIGGGRFSATTTTTATMAPIVASNVPLAACVLVDPMAEEEVRAAINEMKEKVKSRASCLPQQRGEEEGQQPQQHQHVKKVAEEEEEEEKKTTNDSEKSFQWIGRTIVLTSEDPDADGGTFCLFPPEKNKKLGREVLDDFFDKHFTDKPLAQQKNVQPQIFNDENKSLGTGKSLSEISLNLVQEPVVTKSECRFSRQIRITAKGA